MRLDRFITLNLVHPLRRVLDPRSATRDRVLPILMYHSVSEDPEQGVQPYYRVCTSKVGFQKQMQWLKDNGYQGVTLSAGLAWLDSNPMTDNRGWKMQVSRKDSKSSPLSSELQTLNSGLCPVVLTFDDGFRDFYTAAWPVLREFGFTATMYLPTAYLAESSGYSSPLTRHSFRNRDCLTWDEVRWLHRAGIEFGSHTVTHPKLTELTWPEIESELRNSKSEIENQLRVSCTAFAYPYAFPQADQDFTARFKDLLLAGGYETNVTTQIGRVRPGQNSLQLERLPINQDDDLPLLAAKLAGAYDWVGRVQSLTKTIHRTAALPPALSRSSRDIPGKAAERPSGDNSSLSALGRREG